MSFLKTFTNGLLKGNPVLAMLLGMCPVLAITTTVINGIGMGAATIFVLVCSNTVISSLKSIIPKQIRLPAFIVIIAGFVTICGFLLARYFPDIDKALGVFIPLITVNCIILGRAESFASKNSVAKSALDGLGMGIGFTGALILIGSVREIFGNGSWMGINLFSRDAAVSFLTHPAGAFFVLGIIIAVTNILTKKMSAEKTGCKECPVSDACGKKEES
ncbi:MAG: electron transport complex subunit E [Oscillospiraceae bacterium]|nr:electron transport complex subunit E [Oscillospiraceae bacterium]